MGCPLGLSAGHAGSPLVTASRTGIGPGPPTVVSIRTCESGAAELHEVARRPSNPSRASGREYRPQAVAVVGSGARDAAANPSASPIALSPAYPYTRIGWLPQKSSYERQATAAVSARDGRG